MLYTITSLAGYPIQILQSSLDATKQCYPGTYLLNKTRMSGTLFFVHFLSDLREILKGHMFNVQRVTHYQCTNPTIIVRQHDQGASRPICTARYVVVLLFSRKASHTQLSIQVYWYQNNLENHSLENQTRSLTGCGRIVLLITD